MPEPVPASPARGLAPGRPDAEANLPASGLRPVAPGTGPAPVLRPGCPDAEADLPAPILRPVPPGAGSAPVLRPGVPAADLPAPSLAGRAAVEAAGTAFLLMAVVGSGVMATRLTADPGLALLANSLATAAMLFVLVTVLAPLSGAHLNPAVTLAMLARRELGWRPALAYAAAQIAGAVAGTILAHLMFGLPLASASETARTGAGQWLSEGVATFGLVATILLVRSSRPAALAAAIALYIAAAYWFTASTAFANPAAVLGRMLSPTFAGIRPADAGMFVVMQGVGAMVAVGVVRLLDGRTLAGQRG